MYNFKKKSAFTLIEIIVVLIIVGVLAAIALPNLFGNISKSRGSEALSNMSSFKSNVEGCYQSHATIGTSCTALTGTGGFNTTPGNFTYGLITNGGLGVWSIIASNASGTISLARAVGGGITCTSTGQFAGIC